VDKAQQGCSYIWHEYILELFLNTGNRTKGDLLYALRRDVRQRYQHLPQKEMSAAAAAILSNSALCCVQMGKTPQEFSGLCEDYSANTVNWFTF
jgi:hypothetical protein